MAYGARTLQSQIDEIYDDELSFREQLTKFAEVLVSTKNDVGRVVSAVNKLEVNFEQFIDNGAADAAKQLTSACETMKECQDSVEASRRQICESVKEDVQRALSERIDKVSKGLRYVETQLPHLWKGMQKDAENSSGSDKSLEMLERVQQLEFRIEQLVKDRADIPDFDKLVEDVDAMKVSWASANSALTRDVRALTARFNETPPLQMTGQLDDLRGDISALGDLNTLRTDISKLGDLNTLRTSLDECKKKVETCEKFAEDVDALKLTWTSAHTALTSDFREMMSRFNQATPLKLAGQLDEFRKAFSSFGDLNELRVSIDECKRCAAKCDMVDLLHKELSAEVQERSRCVKSLAAEMLRMDSWLKQLASSGDDALSVSMASQSKSVSYVPANFAIEHLVPSAARQSADAPAGFERDSQSVVSETASEARTNTPLVQLRPTAQPRSLQKSVSPMRMMVNSLTTSVPASSIPQSRSASPMPNNFLTSMSASSIPKSRSTSPMASSVPSPAPVFSTKTADVRATVVSQSAKDGQSVVLRAAGPSGNSYQRVYAK